MSENLQEQQFALEEAFFAPVEVRAHSERLRLRELEDAAIDAVAEASDIADRQLLRDLLRVGIRVETLAALTLIPLIEIAWADGFMDEREQKAVLAGARSTGMAEDGPSYALLKLWMEERPAPGMFKLWRGFVASLCQGLNDEEVARFRDNILRRVRVVAEAAGSFLGFGNNISPQEAALLSELRAIFRR